MLINLTPHALRLFPPDTPDEIDPTLHTPTHVIEPSGQVARIAEEDTDGPVLNIDGIAVTCIEFGGTVGLPPYAGHMDERARGTWHIVPLAVGLMADHRADLLVMHRAVRTPDGRVAGCRGFARPV